MRIAVLSDTILPTPTPNGHGLGKAVAHQVYQLARNGHEVTLFAEHGSRSVLNCRVITPDSPIGHRDGEKKLIALANKEHEIKPFDVFIDHGHTHIMSRLYPRRPIVNWYHDIYQPPARCAVLVSYNQRALMGTEWGTEKHNPNNGGWQWVNARVIPNLVKTPRNESGALLPLFNDVPERPPYALFMGAVLSYKQPLLAIAAAARFGIHLVMAGGGAEHLASLSANTDNMTFAGAVHGADKWKLIRDASVFLQLGIVESYGFTTVEAGLCGVPVVAWPSGGTLDLIRDGINGVFVPIGGRDLVGAVSDSIERALFLSREACNVAAIPYSDHHETSEDNQYQMILNALLDTASGRWW